ncbi:MAG TPA: alpha/beta hydrolase, partial [Coleofasciculaceae cyanobacterium]
MHHGLFKKRGLLALMVIGGLSGLIVTALSPRATAAERVVMKYQIFRRSVAVADLTQFAKTGETTRPLRTYLRMSGQDPDKIRKTLTDEVDVNAVTL